MESSFAAALLLDGVSLGTGAASAAFLHVVAVAVTGLLGLPLLRKGGIRPARSLPGRPTPGE
jgi:hypothetical protein